GAGEDADAGRTAGACRIEWTPGPVRSMRPAAPAFDPDNGPAPDPEKGPDSGSASSPDNGLETSPDDSSGDGAGSDGAPDGEGKGAASGRRCTNGSIPVPSPGTGAVGRSRPYPRPAGACGLIRCPGVVRKVGSCQVLNRSRNPSGSVSRSWSPAIRRNGGTDRQPGSVGPAGLAGSDGTPGCPGGPDAAGTAAPGRRRSSRSSKPTPGHSPSLIRVLMRAISPT